MNTLVLMKTFYILYIKYINIVVCGILCLWMMCQIVTLCRLSTIIVFLSFLITRKATLTLYSRVLSLNFKSKQGNSVWKLFFFMFVLFRLFCSYCWNFYLSLLRIPFTGVFSIIKKNIYFFHLFVPNRTM